MIRPLAHHPHMNSGLRSLKRGKTSSLPRKLRLGSFAEGGDVKHFKTGDVVHTGTMLPNYVPIGASNITNAPTYTIEDYLNDLANATAFFNEKLPAGTATTADAINKAVGTNFTTKDLAQFGLTGTGVFVPGNTGGTVTFASTADLLNPNSPDYDPYKAAIDDAMGITGTPTTTENTWGKILDAIQQGVIGIPAAAIGSLFPGLTAAATKAGTSVIDYLAGKVGVDPHWLASHLGGYTTTLTPAGYTFTPKDGTTGANTQTGTIGTGGTMGTTTGGDTLDTVDITGSKVDTTGGGGLGIVTGTGTGIDTGTTTTGDDTLDTVDITGTKTDTTKGGNTGVVTTTTPGAGNGLGTLDTVDITGTKTDTTKGGNTGVVTTTTPGAGNGLGTLDTVDITGTKTDTTKGGNTGVVTTTTPGAGNGLGTLDTVDITGTKTDTTKGGNTGVVTTNTGTGIVTTGDNTAVTGTGTDTTKTTGGGGGGGGGTGIITTTTAGGIKDQPSDVGVPKEGAGTTTFSGIPLFKAFQSAYDPMYSASTSEKYAGTAAQNLQDYMANLNQSLRPGPITPYTFQTAPARTATPQGIASVQSAPPQGQSQGQGQTTAKPMGTLASLLASYQTPQNTTQPQGIASAAAAPTQFQPQTTAPTVKPQGIASGSLVPTQAPVQPQGIASGEQFGFNPKAGKADYIPERETYLKEPPRGIIADPGYTPTESVGLRPPTPTQAPPDGTGATLAITDRAGFNTPEELDKYLADQRAQMEANNAAQAERTRLYNEQVLANMTPEERADYDQKQAALQAEAANRREWAPSLGGGRMMPDNFGGEERNYQYRIPTMGDGSYPDLPSMGDGPYLPAVDSQPRPTKYYQPDENGDWLPPPKPEYDAGGLQPPSIPSIGRGYESGPYDPGMRDPDLEQMPRVVGADFNPFSEMAGKAALAQNPVMDESYYGGRKQFGNEPNIDEAFAHGGSIHGGLGAYAGTYKAGGKLLHGPGDGMSDSIPAVIHGRKPQRAALADGEFVIPADVVSHLGNGSTEAGSRKLYAMMDRVRRARTGNPKQGKQINPDKYMPKV